VNNIDYIETIWGMMAINYAYYIKERSDQDLAMLLDTWKQLLADVPPEVLKAAAFQHIAANKWWPSVAELRELARQLTRPDRLSGIEAWGLVVAEIERTGSWGRPEFDDPNITKAVRTIGWSTICLGEHEASNRARFIECYEILTKREDWTASLLPQVRALVEGTRLLLGEAA
jgi:hypothetical protein